MTDALNFFAFRPDLNIGAFIKALEQDNILQILAEPNLVTTNGKEANFLVGGEFPVPILQGGGNCRSGHHPVQGVRHPPAVYSADDREQDHQAGPAPGSIHDRFRQRGHACRDS